LIEQLKNDLSSSPFSLIVDNVTATGKSICGMQVKYLKHYIDEMQVQRTSIENRVIGLKYLECSSSTETIYNVVKEKVFNLSPEISSNFRGFVHDHAANLSGLHNGLGVKLKEDLPNKFMDLGDPCHSLNLALSKALKILPKEIMKFVKKIHNHFSWPQRVAFLSKIQKGNNQEILNLVKFVPTRWLSIGQCLKRLLLVWDSLKEYMKQQPSLAGTKKKSFDYFLKFLENKQFYLKIVCLSGLINKLNLINIKFQAQKMEIHKLKIEMLSCIRELAELFIVPTILPKDLTLLDTDEWVNNENSKNNFLSHLSFVSKLATEVDIRLDVVKTWSESNKIKFTEYSKHF